LKRFGEEVGHHVSGRTIFDPQLLLFNLIGHKEVANVNVLGASSTRCPPVFLQEHSTLIVLVDNVVFHFVTLSGDEIMGPNNQWHTIVHTYQFSFSGAFGVEPLFS
jgi:hypothetical protein